MYTALIAFLVAQSLLSANMLFVLGTAVSVALVYRRMTLEEALLAERFGDLYQEYTRRTGRLWPRIVGDRARSGRRKD
jgi:protein-S-isoprenylcysteine O-methyltransferase Ste14